MADWEDWEAQADSGTVEIKKDPKFDEVDEAVPIEKKEDLTIKSQPQNADKVVYSRYSQ